MKVPYFDRIIIGTSEKSGCVGFPNNILDVLCMFGQDTTGGEVHFANLFMIDLVLPYPH